MNILRQIIRAIFGTTAQSFNTEQETELLDFIEKQAEKREVYITDVTAQVDANVALSQKLALKVAEGEAELSELLGGE
jgi:hypothetical protein